MNKLNGRVRRSLRLCLILLLVFPGVAGATSPSEGVIGADGNPLSITSTIAGSGVFDDQNGESGEAAFRAPEGILILDDGTVIVADTLNHRIRMIEQDLVASYAGFEWLPADENNQPVGGMLDGDRNSSVFHQPKGMALDEKGNVYVADTMNHSIRKISPQGEVTTVAGDGVLGDRDGTGDSARFYAPTDVAVAEDGTIYVADTLNHVIRQITVDGKVRTLNAKSERTVEISDGDVVEAGDYKDGPLGQALFNEPAGIAIDSVGNLYVSDSGNHLIRYIDLANQTVQTVAGHADFVYEEQAPYAAAGDQDGAAEDAMFHFPKGIALTEEGGVVVADSMNHRVRYIYDGRVMTLAGGQTRGNLNDINNRNQLEFPTDVAVQGDGTILIADTYSNQIRAINFYEIPSFVTNEQIDVLYGMEPVVMDTQPEVVNHRTMVPVRAVSEHLGYQVDYDSEHKVLRLQIGDKSLLLKVDDVTLEIEEGEDHQVITMDVAPYTKESRVYVPLRFLSESLDYDVQWDHSTRTVIIR